MKRFATLSLSLGMTIFTYSQQFVQRTGSENILNGIDIGTNSAPVFADIDNDLDQDMFTGTGSGFILFFKNTGSRVSPVLTQQHAENNPFGTLTVPGSANLSLIDIDKDGDLDAFVGSRSGELLFYRNEGTKEAAIFSPVTSGNPLAQVLTEFQSSSWFVDIDGDLDLDVFVGGNFQVVDYYQNTGTPQNAVFSLIDLSENPLQLTNASSIMFPVFVDIDKDGDSDAFLGSSGNSIPFYQNLGSQTNPLFTRQTGSLNPLNSFSQLYSFPAFADLDLDGDVDVIIGQANGTFSSYQNNTVLLPLKLIAFSAIETSKITITWKTVEEKNTSSFQLEKSDNGINFTSLKAIPAIGTGSNSYVASDNRSASVQYYRLKMIDSDGSHAFSSIIHTNPAAANLQVKIYPNPAGKNLKIDLPVQTALPIRAAVLDYSGRVLLNTEINSRHSILSVQQIKAGNYVLKLSNGTSQSFLKK